MNEHNDERIVEAMAKFGGSFAQSIAKAARCADRENYIRLKTAFPDLWDRYATFVPQPLRPIAP